MILSMQKGNGETIIGDGCLIMASSHIGHDCVLANKVVQDQIGS